MSIHETLILYPDLNGLPDFANPVGPNEAINFGNVELDAFGNIAGGPPRIPLYVANNAGSDITLTVEGSGDGPQPIIVVLFGPRGGDMSSAPDNATGIGIGQIYSADLGIEFIALPGTGDHTFVVNFTAESEAVPIPAGPSRIAFTSNSDENRDIYIMDADGSNLSRLTDHPGWDSKPAWSPDGSKIAFRSNRNGNSEIWVMEADGSNPTNITNYQGADHAPAWFPDGTKIVFQSSRDGGFADIYVMDADGSDPTRLTDHPDWEIDPAWSPDGAKIAFWVQRIGLGRSVWVMDADGTNQTQIYNPGESPAWSPDGTRIAFHSQNHIWVTDADGSNPTNLTNQGSTNTEPAWAPDGTRIAFVSNRISQRDIWVMDADGSNQMRLTSDPQIFDTDPAWSPGVVPTLQWGQLHGSKFHDQDADGVWDGNEPGLPDFTIVLDIWDDGTGDRLTQTNSTGDYFFIDVPPAPFALWESPPPGWVHTQPANGSYAGELSAGQVIENLDFGNVEQ